MESNVALKNKKSFIKRFNQFCYYLADNLDTRCFVASAICHIGILLALYFFVSPPAGRPDGEMLVSYSSEDVGKPDDAPNTENPENKPSTEEVDPETAETSEEAIQEIKDSLQLDEKELKTYIKERQDKIAQKKKNAADFSSQQKNIDKALHKRSSYGTLQPRTFYGVNIMSRKMLFVLDISGSMDIEEARIQLKNAYSALKPTEYFNIIVYSNSVHTWKQIGLVPASLENQKDAEQWLCKFTNGGATNMYEALEKAFSVSQLQARADVIYFLSDGLPTIGKELNPARILASVRGWNRSAEIVIHTIGIGPHQDMQFLKALAKENHGNYYVR